MDYLENIKKELSDLVGVDVNDFSYPPDQELGDLCIPMFSLAKENKQSPVILAQQKAKELELIKGIIKVEAVGPYLNFFLDRQELIAQVIISVKSEADNFGHENKSKNYQVMVEYSNGNTHKELHIGHLRNICYGSSVARILKADAYDVVPVSYINDFGIHTAKTIWNWLNNPSYQDSSLPKGYLLGKCYSEAASKLTDNEEGKKEVSLIMKDIEQRKGDTYRFWQESRQWSIDYFQSVYNDLDINFTETFYENELIDEGFKIKDKLIDKGILKLSQGAIIADLEEFNLGVMPVIRSDGTALYPVADLALASHKFEKYQLQESIYVVDVRQSLYFSQLFQVLKLMGYKAKMTHLSYDFLKLKTGMMASRTGNVVTYQEVLDEAVSKASIEISKRHKDWSDDKIKTVARDISLAAIKFEMVKVSADKIITFDIEESLKFEGYTAAYLQYTGARISSLLSKGNMDNSLDYNELSHVKEFSLALKLLTFKEVINKSALSRDPSLVARYLFELAQKFNDYYHDVNILKSSDSVRSARLSLVLSVQQVLKNGFELLGINYLNEM